MNFPIAMNNVVTPTLTSTSTQSPTSTPTKVAKKKKPKPTDDVSVAYKTMVKVSHYTPWTGGTNCSRFVNGECLSNVAMGGSWKDWVDSGAACVSSWPFGTKFRLPDGTVWTCVDRGGGIVQTAQGAWVDLLTDHPGYYYGEVVEAEILN